MTSGTASKQIKTTTRRTLATLPPLISSFRPQCILKNVGRYVARVIVLPVFRMLTINHFILEPCWRSYVLILCVKRQRQNSFRESRIVISVFYPPITHDHVIAYPACGWRRLLRKPKRHLVARIHYHVAIVGAQQQLTHVTKPRIVADQIAPDLF